MAGKILKTEDPQECMRLGNKLGENAEWTRDCVTYLRPILKEKFDQNPELKAKLIVVKGHFYEATTHPVFGAGLTLTQSHKICKENTTVGNKLDEELDSLRDYYIRSQNE